MKYFKRIKNKIMKNRILVQLDIWEKNHQKRNGVIQNRLMKSIIT